MVGGLLGSLVVVAGVVATFWVGLANVLAQIDTNDTVFGLVIVWFLGWVLLCNMMRGVE